MRTKNAEKLSQRLLYVLVGLTSVIFGAFYLIGFDRPSFNDSSSNDPLLTGMLLSFMLLLLAGALGVGVWASGHGLLLRRKERNMMTSSSDGGTFFHSTMGLSVMVASLTIIALVVFFLIGSSAEMTINGEPFIDSFWLKTSDMFINTSLLMLVVALGTMMFGAIRYYMKGGQ